MATPEFWISVGSTYSYLTVSRLPALEERLGIAFDWRPFSVREIMVEMDNIPFATKPAKAAYMWRDIARRAAARGLSPRLPAAYPLAEFDLANRVAVLGRAEGWGRDYIRHAYRLWFDEGLPAGGAENLAACCAALGLDGDGLRDRALSDATGALYREATDAARARGIFGAPSFVVEGELFWGDDRLEDALGWARDGRVPPG